MVESQLTVHKLGRKPIKIGPLFILALVQLFFDLLKLILPSLAQNLSFVEVLVQFFLLPLHLRAQLRLFFRGWHPGWLG